MMLPPGITAAAHPQDDDFANPAKPPAFVNDTHRHMVTQAQQAAQNFTPPQNTSSLEKQPPIPDGGGGGGGVYHNENDYTVKEVFDNYNSATSNHLNVHGGGKGAGTPIDEVRPPGAVPPPSYAPGRGTGSARRRYDEFEDVLDGYDDDDDDEDEENDYGRRGGHNDRRPNRAASHGAWRKFRDGKRSSGKRVVGRRGHGHDDEYDSLSRVDERDRHALFLRDAQVALLTVIAFVLISLVPVEEVVSLCSSYSRGYMEWVSSIPYPSLLLRAVLMGCTVFGLLRLMSCPTTEARRDDEDD